MAEAALPIAAISSIASLGLSAAGTVSKGKGEQAADQFKADQAETAARFGQEQAQLTDVTGRERLLTTLGNIDAIRAAGNIDPSSPTTSAVEDWQRQISDRQRTTAVVSETAQSESDLASAKYLRQAGDFAVANANTAALAGVLGGISKFALSAGGGGGGGSGGGGGGDG